MLPPWLRNPKHRHSPHTYNLCWMKHIGINAKVASHVFSLLASVEGTTVCLEIPLQSPPPPGDRHLATVSPPHPGDRRVLTREFARGAGGRKRFGTQHLAAWASLTCPQFSTPQMHEAVDPLFFERIFFG